MESKKTGKRKILADGYVAVYFPQHPKCDKTGYVKEHRIIVEIFIGRLLTDEEVVHHINEVKSDNRISNLMLFPTNSAHIKFHLKIRQFGITNNILRQIKNRWDGLI